MFMRLKYKRQSERRRQARMQELREYIDRVTREETKNAETPQEGGEAADIVYQITQCEENELEHLQQLPLLNKLRRSPIEVPKDYWNDLGDRAYKPTLTCKGEAWARHELKKLRNTEIEFWFKLVMPVIALVLSIIALVKRH